MEEFSVILKGIDKDKKLHTLPTFKIRATTRANAEIVAKERILKQGYDLRTFGWIETTDNKKAIQAIVFLKGKK